MTAPSVEVSAKQMTVVVISSTTNVANVKAGDLHPVIAVARDVTGNLQWVS